MSGVRNRVLVGDAQARLRDLPGVSVDQVVTSPPYFNLRDYGHIGQLGAEVHVDLWVSRLIEVARELARVMTPTATFWLNVGDSYSLHARQGAGARSLLLAPERLALALIADGWLLRNKLVWQKANPMPTSVRNRFACTWEYVFVLARRPDYFFDLDSVRLPHVSTGSKRERRTAAVRGRSDFRGTNSVGTAGLAALKAAGIVGHPLGKNPGDVLRLASSNYRGDHRATFPESLAAYSVQAGCPEAVCSVCRRPWLRQLLRATDGTARRAALTPSCDCSADSQPGLVLDPFIGAGTTAVAAERLGRHWLGIELNPEFAAEATQRITDVTAQRRAA